MKKIFLTGLLAVFACAMLAACGSAGTGDTPGNDPQNTQVPEVADTSDYPDPPEDQRDETFNVFMAWDGAGGETWDYAFSVDGILEECDEPASPEPELNEDGEMMVVVEAPIPGGLMLWFRGVSPGDVVATFTTYDANEEVVEIKQYAVRVFDDLKVAQLDEETADYRDYGDPNGDLE